MYLGIEGYEYGSAVGTASTATSAADDFCKGNIGSGLVKGGSIILGNKIDKQIDGINIATPAAKALLK